MTDEIESEIWVDFTQQINVVRIIGKTIIPTTLNIKAEIIPADEHDDEEFFIAHAKICFWFDNIVSRCVIYEKGNSFVGNMLISKDGKTRCTNMLMVCPEEPSDHVLCALFQSKMNALSGDACTFGNIEIKASNSRGLVYTFSGIGQDILPLMEDWVGERSYFSEPWWDRDDSSTLDVVPKKDADITIKPEWAFDLDFIEKTMRPHTPSILQTDFNPEVIDGGADK